MQIYTYIDSNLATQDEGSALDWLRNIQNKKDKKTHAHKFSGQFEFYSDMDFEDN